MTTFPRMAKGFTLIELMIVVAVIAILAAIAYPSYINHVVDTRRTAATACVIEQAQYMERYYTSEMTFAIPRDEFPEFGCETDLADFYDIDFAADPTALAFTIQAVPQGAQQRDTECGTLSLNQVGNRGETGTGTPDDCW